MQLLNIPHLNSSKSRIQYGEESPVLFSQEVLDYWLFPYIVLKGLEADEVETMIVASHILQRVQSIRADQTGGRKKDDQTVKGSSPDLIHPFYPENFEERY